MTKSLFRLSKFPFTYLIILKFSSILKVLTVIANNFSWFVLDKSNMNRIESGNTNPSILILKKISDELGISLTELFDF